MTATAWPHLVPDAVARALPKEEALRRLLDHSFEEFAPDLRATGAVKAGVEATVRARVEATAKEMGIAFTPAMYDHVAAAYARQHAYDRGVLADISAATQEVVGTTLQQAYSGGWTYAETAAALSAQFDNLEVWQVQRIARTEVANASRFASVQSAQNIARDHGLVISRAVLVPMGGCEEICRPLVARSYDENWTPAQAAVEIEALHPNCLHDIAYQVEN